MQFVVVEVLIIIPGAEKNNNPVRLRTGKYEIRVKSHLNNQMSMRNIVTLHDT